MTIKTNLPKNTPTKIIKPRLSVNWSEYQKEIFRDIARGFGNTIVIARAGSSKCLGKGTPVLMFDGSIKPVELVEIGDKVMGPDSKPRNVLDVASGVSNLVEINPIKGDSWVCNDDHILTLIKSNHGKGQITDISVKDFINENKHFKRIDKNWKLLRTGVSFKRKELEVDPYLVGLWIGNGTKSNADITSADDEIINFCKNIAGKYKTEAVVKREKYKAYRIRFRVGKVGSFNSKKDHNKLLNFYKNNCIHNNEKIIPTNYLINSENNRLQLLAGIIDSNGSANKNNLPTTSIATVSKTLADQYAFLARSLGFSAYIKEKISSIKSTNFVGKYYSVSISGDLSKIPTILPRKRFNKRKQIKNHLCTGFDIKQLGLGGYYGFTLDGDGRFLLGDFTITHNTTSLVEGARYIPRGKSALFCAFNKHIKEELQLKLPHHVKASTLHSIGFQAIRNRFKITTLDTFKCFKLAEEIIGNKNENFALIHSVCDAVGFCKATLTDVPSKIEGIIDQYGIDLCETNIDIFIKYVMLTLRACKEKTNTVDYNDMIWFPFVYRIQPPKFDYVFIDEAQDLNRAQIELALSCSATGGRIIAVLDNFQAIYSFMGADSKMFEVLKERLSPKELKLPICYRCPRLIVESLQSLVPDILPWDGSKDGEIIDLEIDNLIKTAKAGDVVISRTNAPLIKNCMKFIKAGIPANMLGRDIGDGLTYLIKKSKKKTVKGLLTYLNSWSAKEISRVTARNPKANTDFITDKVECIEMMCDGVTNVDDVIKNIDYLFQDGDTSKLVLFSSAHKFKGMEAKNVFVLTDTLRSFNQEERNIIYVALSRSKEKLYLVRNPSKQNFSLDDLLATANFTE